MTAYQAAAATQSEIDRTAEDREKTGVWTGSFAVNPVNGEQIPIWIAGLCADGLRHGRNHGGSSARPARL